MKRCKLAFLLKLSTLKSLAKPNSNAPWTSQTTTEHFKPIISLSDVFPIQYYPLDNLGVLKIR